MDPVPPGESVLSPEQRQRRDCVESSRAAFDFSIFATKPSISDRWKDDGFDTRYGRKLFGIGIPEGEMRPFGLADPQFSFRVSTAASEVVQNRYEDTLTKLTQKKEHVFHDLMELGNDKELVQVRSRDEIDEQLNERERDQMDRSLTYKSYDGKGFVVSQSLSGGYLLVTPGEKAGEYKVIDMDALYEKAPDELEGFIARYYEDRLIEEFITKAVDHLAYHTENPRDVLNLGIDSLPEALKVTKAETTDASTTYLFVIRNIDPETHDYLRNQSSRLRYDAIRINGASVDPQDYLDHMDVCSTVLLPDQLYIRASKGIYDAVYTDRMNPEITLDTESVSADRLAFLRDPIKFTDNYIDYQVSRLKEQKNNAQTVVDLIGLLKDYKDRDSFFATIAEQKPEFYEKFMAFKEAIGDENFSEIIDQGSWLTKDIPTLRRIIERRLSHMRYTPGEKQWIHVYDTYSETSTGTIKDPEISRFLPFFVFIASQKSAYGLEYAKELLEGQDEDLKEEATRFDPTIATYENKRKVMDEFIQEHSITREDIETLAQQMTRNEEFDGKQYSSWRNKEFYYLFTALWLNSPTTSPQFMATMKVALPIVDFTVLNSLPSRQT